MGFKLCGLASCRAYVPSELPAQQSLPRDADDTGDVR